MGVKCLNTTRYASILGGEVSPGAVLRELAPGRQRLTEIIIIVINIRRFRIANAITMDALQRL